MRSLRLLLLVLLSAVVSAQTDTSRDALFAAIRRGSVADVDRLLKAGASPNIVDADGTPALMAATLFGDTALVKLLLERGADPNRTGAGGTTALMWAVPNVEKVRVLLERGANVNARSETDRSAFLVAASYPRTVDVLRLLLDRGADMRAQDRANATALSLAVRSADVDVVRFLVERGLDLNALPAGPRRAGFLRNDLPTTDYVMSKAPTPNQDLLGTAATWQPANVVARWIELGADVNASFPQQYARTPLMNAVTSEFEGADTLKLLLEKGADPNAEMTEGERPLDWAIYKGDGRRSSTRTVRRDARSGSAP